MEMDSECEMEEEILSDSSMEGLKEQRKRMINSRSWLKLHWPSIAPNTDHSCQISRNLVKFLAFLNFLCKKQVFPAGA